MDKDEYPKFGTTIEDLQKLKPAFLKVIMISCIFFLIKVFN